MAPLARRGKVPEPRHVMSLVSLVVGVLSLGAQTTFLKFVSAESLNELGATTLLKVFLQTAPLTIAVMLIALAAIQEWWKEMAPLLFFAAAMLFLSVFLGSWFGGLGQMPSIQGNLGAVFFNSLAFYWRHYGPSLFLSSLILGVFLAWFMTKEGPQAIARIRRAAGAK